MRVLAKRANDHELARDAIELRMRAERQLNEMIQAQKATVGLNAGAREPGVGRRGTRVDEKPAFANAALDAKYEPDPLGRIALATEYLE